MIAPFGGNAINQSPLDASNVQRGSHADPEQEVVHEICHSCGTRVPGGGNGRQPSSKLRELVRLPEPMQEHMLGNMRDHLATLNEIIGDVADGKFDAAAKLSEQRLGMSSLGLHGAAHMAPFMPKPMQDIGTSMHRAASRLNRPARHLGVADVRYDRDVSRALHGVTTTCVACHASYRIR